MEGVVIAVRVPAHGDHAWNIEPQDIAPTISFLERRYPGAVIQTETVAPDPTAGAIGDTVERHPARSGVQRPTRPTAAASGAQSPDPNTTQENR